MFSAKIDKSSLRNEFYRKQVFPPLLNKTFLMRIMFYDFVSEKNPNITKQHLNEYAVVDFVYTLVENVVVVSIKRHPLSCS